MNKSSIYYTEKDGAVKIPDEYKTMTYDEISAECTRLQKAVKSKTTNSVKKVKKKCKTKFVI